MHVNLTSKMSDNYPLLPKATSTTTTTPPPKQRMTAGSIALISLIFAWVSQAELSKSLQHGSATIKPYNKPFFITILNQSMMVVAFGLNVFFLPKTQLCSPSKYLKDHGLSIRKVAMSGSFLAVIYCASTYFWFTSIGKNTVSVSVASGIYNSSVVWVFLLSLIFKIETFTIPKAIGVVLAIVGVALSSTSSSSTSPPSLSPSSSSPSSSPSPFTWSVSSSSPSSLPAPSSMVFNVGYIEVIGSAMLYALFEVVLKLITNAALHRRNKNTIGSKEEEVPIGIANIFTGTIGLAHLFLLSFLFIPFNAFGWEIFEWPSSSQWGLLWLNAGMGTMFNVSFVAAIALMSPTLVSVSCLLTIPIAAITDLILNNYRAEDQHVSFTSIKIVGLCCICLGFLAFVGICGQEKEEKEKEQEEGV